MVESAIKSTINTFVAGMNMDIDASSMKGNQYRYAENVHVSSFDESSSGSLSPIDEIFKFDSIVKYYYNKMTGRYSTDSSTSLSNEYIIGASSVRDYGVIFTIDKSTGKLRIYRIEFGTDGYTPKLYHVFNKTGLSCNITKDTPISIVTRYEDDHNIKVYWADGLNYIRVANISSYNNSYNSNISSIIAFDIVPTSNLLSPVINNISNLGSLRAGVYQYCYQLYNKNSSETSISSMTSPVSVVDSTISNFSSDYVGTGILNTYGKETNKSIFVKIPIDPSYSFNRVKLISVYYYNYGSAPVINIIKDQQIVSGSEYVILEDSGSEIIGELTTEEFNLLGGQTIKANYIESKDNILFAANTVNETFDVEYDTRAFGFNSDGVSRLYDSDLETYTDYSTDDIVPDNIDAINKSIYTEYKYSNIDYNLDKNGNLGGQGANVKYNFANTYLIESYGNYWNSQILDNPTIASISYQSSWRDYYENTIGSTPRKTTASTQFFDIDKNAVLRFRFKASGGIDGTAVCNYSLGVYKDGVPYGPYYFGNGSNSFETISHNVVPGNYQIILSCEYIVDGNYGTSFSGLYGLDGEDDIIYVYSDSVLSPSIVDSIGDDTWSDLNRLNGIKYIDQRTARIGDRNRNINELIIKSSDGVSSSIGVDYFGIPTHNGFLNYSNPYLSNLLTSYHRDEIYRFAAVLYDEKGRKSPAKWIADIRFPANYCVDSKWESNIFEMPSEVKIESSPYYNTYLKDQELLVKPLGLLFTFSNIPTSVKKIEIVRSKRDMNNRTILLQGVIQKVGTQFKEYYNSSTTNIDKTKYLNSGIHGTLRPHSIISMGYNYSICGPILSTDKSSMSFSGYAPSLQGYIGELIGDTIYDMTGSTIKTSIYYTDHSVSPYFYNRNYLFFVSPDVSHYGEDIVNSIYQKNISSYLDVVDILSPITTPSTSGGNSYIGNIGMLASAGLMYCGADITQKGIYSDIPSSDYNTWYSMSLSGTLSGIIHNSDLSETSKNISNIYTTSGAFYETGKRAFISLGGFMYKYAEDQYPYKSGVYGSPSEISRQTNDPAIVKNDASNNSCRSGISFKLYSSFVNGIYNSSYGGDSYYTIRQDGNLVSDITVSSQKHKIYDAFNPVLISDMSFSGELIPGNQIGEYSQGYVSIGNSSYLNYARPLTYGDGTSDDGDSGGNIKITNSNAKTKVSGIHGSGIVLSFDDSDTIPSISSILKTEKRYSNGTIPSSFYITDMSIKSGLSTYLVNMKKMSTSIYGGISSTDRQYTDYISTGATIIVEDGITNESKYVFGGDTFIGIFDYATVYANDPMGPVATNSSPNINETRLDQVRHVSTLIPMESSVNMRLDLGKTFVTDDYNFAIERLPGVYGPAISSGSTWTNTQSYKQYDYNSGYSSEKIALGFVSKLFSDESNKKFDCRVWASEIKTNDELIDSWSKFKSSNYIDVDSQYGQITRIKKFNYNLFFWQENAFGTIQTNERSLISDNNVSKLVLGTGDLLSRYDYISTTGGLKYGVFNSVGSSDYGLYWFDHNKSQLASYSPRTTGNGTSRMILSYTKGIQTALNSSKAAINDENNVAIIHDTMYDEMYITIPGISTDNYKE